MANVSSDNKKHRFSLAHKLNLVTILMILAVTAGLLAITYHIQAGRIEKLYRTRAADASRNAADVIDSKMADHFRRYIDTDEFMEVRKEAVASGDETLISNWLKTKPSGVIDDETFREFLEDPEYAELARTDLSLYSDYVQMADSLQVIMDDSEIKYTYLQYIRDEEYFTLVDPDLGILGIGEMDEEVPEFEQYDEYQQIPPTIYHCSYGWLCTAYEPLKLPDTGEMVALAGADIDMNEVRQTQRKFLANSIILVILLTSFCIIINMYLIRHIAVMPLTALAKGACGFAEGENGYSMADVIHADIDSNDEIGDLYHEIQDMQTRIVHYTDDLASLTAEKARAGTEMQLAARIQSSMLESDFPVFPNRHEFELYASMTPAREVGGDFYDFFLVDDNHLAMIIADVSGKGVPGALFMMSSMILIRNQTHNGGTPAEILEAINEGISKNNKAKMFVTVWMGILDTGTGVMTCANAGHEFPVLKGGDGIYRLIKDKHGFVIGGMEGMKYKDYELTLSPGDMLFVYTDGVPEANNKEQEFYGTGRMIDALNAAAPDTPAEVLHTVKASVDAFADGAEQYDDLTMLCLKYKGQG